MARTLTQILRITVLETGSLQKCNSVTRTLERRGLVSTTQKVDVTNPEHVKLIVQARESRNNEILEDPLICIQDSADKLTLVATDSSMAAVNDLVTQEARMQLMLAPV